MRAPGSPGTPALDGDDLLGQPGQQGRGVARAGADFEDAVAGVQPQGLNGDAHDVRLGDGLIVTDRQRRVLVRELLELIRKKGVARGVAERLQHARIGDAASGELKFHHASAEGGEVHFRLLSKTQTAGAASRRKTAAQREGP